MHLCVCMWLKIGMISDIMKKKVLWQMIQIMIRIA